MLVPGALVVIAALSVALYVAFRPRSRDEMRVSSRWLSEHDPSMKVN